jgi:N-methylhydantoinase B
VAFAPGEVSRRRLCRLHSEDAAARGLSEHMLVEMDTGRAAPLRGWIRVDAGVAAGTLPLDAIGLSILRAGPGEGVEVRPVRALPA